MLAPDDQALIAGIADTLLLMTAASPGAKAAGAGAAIQRLLTDCHELAERAYFSSEVGMTRALRYVRVPGHWSGCVPLAPGQPAWR